MHPVSTIARYVLIEARRSALPWLALVAIAIALALASFVSRVAITEGQQLRAVTGAALLRLCAVFFVAVHVAASMVRESADKTMDLVLSQPVSRSAYYIGKLAGFAACGALLSAFLSLPLLLWSAPAAVAGWAFSLAAESVLVAATCLFFAITLTQALPALAATAGLYLLARSLAAMQAIATWPLVSKRPLQEFAGWAIDLVGLLMPRLDAVTRSDWLAYGLPAAADYARALAGIAVFIALVTAAGMVDFQRRNL